jgi:hypothetical protein
MQQVGRDCAGRAGGKAVMAARVGNAGRLGEKKLSQWHAEEPSNGTAFPPCVIRDPILMVVKTKRKFHDRQDHDHA